MKHISHPPNNNKRKRITGKQGFHKPDKSQNLLFFAIPHSLIRNIPDRSARAKFLITGIKKKDYASRAALSYTLVM